MKPLLEIQNLAVSYQNSGSNLLEISNFNLNPEAILAVVGESGSGKTTFSRSITRLFPHGLGHKAAGKILFGGNDLLTCDEESLRQVRELHIRYIFQDPQQALNPILRIRRQLQLSARQQLKGISDLKNVLNSVGLTDADRILSSYPHQLSVGMAQRVMIAMALLAKPSLIIADEPTSALDASLRNKILDLLISLQKQLRFAVIVVTHDLRVARTYATEIAVLHQGRVVERSATVTFFKKPQHPYSKLLLESTPAHRRTTIPGESKEPAR